MGIFGKRIDIKNATKTTYSEEDLRKLDLNYRDAFRNAGEKRIYSPFRRETPRAWQSQIRDMAFEKILDDGTYSFRHLLVIPNPYGASVQTALLLFNTAAECRVRYRVRGKTEETDFLGETDITTRHRVPIMGLYKGYTNQLELELLNPSGEVTARRELRIYTRDIPLTLQNIVTKVEHSTPSCFPYILVNGLRFKPVVFDQNGEVRYSLQIRTDRTGMIPLQNGRFLYADASVSRVTENGGTRACQYHEMDYMGRVYQTYLLDAPVRGFAALEGDSLFLLSSSEAGFTGDCLIELDRRTGVIRKRCPLADLIGDKYRKKGAWTMASGLDFCDGQLILTMRRFHTVLSIDWNSQTVNWALAPESIWKGTVLEEKLLVSADDSVVDGYMPEKPDIQSIGQGLLRLQIYCIQNKGAVPAQGAVSDEDSRIVFYEIDCVRRTFCRKRSVAVVKSKRDGGCVYQADSERLLSLSGMLMRRSVNLRACIEELDGQTGAMRNRLRLCKRYCNAWVFAPDIRSCCVPLTHAQDTIRGMLMPPDVFEGDLPELTSEKLLKRTFANPRLSDRLFLFSLRPGAVQNVYLAGKTHVYVQRFSTLKKKKKQKQRKTGFCIALDALEPDEYQVYVEADGLLYPLKNEIRIEKSQKEK